MEDFKEKNCKIALIQDSPVLFDKQASTAKAVKLIKQVATEKPELIVFPELFIPGYPFGMNFGFVVGGRHESGRKDWWLYADNSLVVPGPETKVLGQAAKEASAYLSIGVSERDRISGSLYNSNLIFGPDGSLLSVHRKLKPTGSERLVWADANKDYFPVVDSPWGKMGSLICWESYMPLARVALYQKGISIYISPNTNDNPEWQDTIKHIAIEGHVFFINSDMIINKSDYPIDRLHANEEIAKLDDHVCRGGSCIVDPYGHYLTQPVWDQKTIIYADLPMEEVPQSKMEMDAIGHYSRPDVLDLHVNDK